MTPFIIVRRSRPDWKSPRFKLWAKAERHEAVWNDTFKLTFREYRHELQKIAAENHRQVKGADFGRPKDRSVVIPVDDDDWFSPDMIDRLRAAMKPNAVGLHWQSNELLNGRLIPCGNPGCIYCKTNNYCYRPGPGRGKWINHVGAEYAFREEKEIQYLDRPLNLVNRTLGSFTSLEHRIPEGTLRDYWESTVTNFSKLTIPEHLGWITPYVEQVHVLIKRLG